MNKIACVRTQAVLAMVVSDTPKGCVGVREIKNEFTIKYSLKFVNAIFNKFGKIKQKICLYFYLLKSFLYYKIEIY